MYLDVGERKLKGHVPWSQIKHVEAFGSEKFDVVIVRGGCAASHARQPTGDTPALSCTDAAGSRLPLQGVGWADRRGVARPD